MFASLSAVLVPVVIGIFHPTTDLKIEGQKSYVRVSCATDLSCPETKTYVDQGFACMQPNNKKSLCVKNIDQPGVSEDLLAQAVAPWQGAWLETYALLQEPELVFNTVTTKQWLVSQKAWLHVGTSNQDFIVYETGLLAEYDQTSLICYFDPGSEDYDLSFQIDANGKDLWRRTTVQTGSGDQFLKTTVSLRWTRTEDQK